MLTHNIKSLQINKLQRLRIALVSHNEVRSGPKKKMGRPVGSKNKFRVDGLKGYQITDNDTRAERERKAMQEEMAKNDEKNFYVSGTNKRKRKKNSKYM